MTFRYVFQELRHHHHRTAVNILGIAVGIAFFVAMNALGSAYQEALRLPLKNVGADVVVQKAEKRPENSPLTNTAMQGIRLPFANQLLSATERDAINDLPEVSDKAASLLLWEFAPDGFKTMMGLNPAQPGLGPVKVKDWIVEGRFLEQNGEIILEKHFAKFKNAKLHDSILIANKPFKVVGLLSIKEGAQIAAANSYISIDDAGALLGSNPNEVNIVYLRLKDPSLQSIVKSKIEKSASGITVVSADSSLEVMGGISKISGQFAVILSWMALAGAILLIVRSMIANLATRANQIWILKAVGWTSKNVHCQIMAEALLQSLTGGALGLIFGYSAAFLLSNAQISLATPAQINQLPSMARNSAAATSNSVTLPVQISAELIFTALLIAIFSGLLASYLMGKRTDRMKPADIMREL